MAKQIVYGEASRQAMLRGIDRLADAVKVTLGPARGQGERARHRTASQPHSRELGIR